jgi:copper resistance protein C
MSFTCSQQEKIKRLQMEKSMKNKLICSLALLFLVFAPQFIWAHALLVSSTPTVRATLHGPDIAIGLKFNCRIDGTRSRMTLVLPNGEMQNLQVEKQTSPDGLSSHTQLKSGTYTLRWQVLAVDGHITRGVIPFTVQ